MSILSSDVLLYPQTQAQWDADDRVFAPNVVAVVTDGANIGRKKWFDDVHTFAQLSYTDEGGGGGAPSGPAGGDLSGTYPDPTIEGQASGIPMTYSNAVIGAPAQGIFRFDSLTPASIANAFIHMTAPTGVDNAGLWSLNNPQRGYVQVTHSGGVLVMQFNGEGANNSGVYEAPMVHVSGPLPSNNAPCRVVYLPGQANVPNLVVNATRQATAIPIVITGTTDGSGRVTVDLDTASTDRPALSAFHFVGGSETTGGVGVVAYPQDITLGAYVVQFWNLAGAAEIGQDVPVSFFGWGIPA